MIQRKRSSDMLYKPISTSRLIQICLRVVLGLKKFKIRSLSKYGVLFSAVESIY